MQLQQVASRRRTSSVPLPASTAVWPGAKVEVRVPLLDSHLKASST